MSTIQGILDYFAANPMIALIFIFIIAMAEAVVVIGLFVPSTAVLVGAGTLVGVGKLDLWPVLIATFTGAVVGDQISFWAGRFYGQRLKQLWPLNRYPSLVERGEEFFALHGGKSVAIGRFVPAVKAIVPGVAGMLGMGQARFIAINVSSAIVWAAAHVLPGVLVGKGLAVAGELSGRLAIVLGLLLAVLFVAGWLVRMLVLALMPLLAQGRTRFSAWALGRRERPIQWLGEVFAPERRRALPVMLLSAIGIFSAVGLAKVTEQILARDTLYNADISLSNYLASLRSAPADQLMVAITMLGDTAVMLPLALVIIGWLAWRRSWHIAGAAAVAIAASAVFVPLMKLMMQRPRPAEFYSGVEAYSFPSGHATMATVIIGILAVLLGLALKPWSKALVYAGLGIVVAMIAFSRLYLGAHFPSDVLAGILFALMMTASFAIAVVATPRRHIAPIGLALLAGFVTLITIGGHLALNYPIQLNGYMPRDAETEFARADWLAKGFDRLPPRRIDLRGHNEEPFILQYAGDTEPLKAALAAAGWTAAKDWNWQTGLTHLDPHTPLADLPPRPFLHEGLRPDSTFVKQGPAGSDQRYVLRIWPTRFGLAGGTPAARLSVASVTAETRGGVSFLLVFPHSAIPQAAVLKDLQSGLVKTGRIKISANPAAGTGLPVLLATPL